MLSDKPAIPDRPRSNWLSPGCVKRLRTPAGACEAFKPIGAALFTWVFDRFCSGAGNALGTKESNIGLFRRVIGGCARADNEGIGVAKAAVRASELEIAGTNGAESGITEEKGADVWNCGKNGAEVGSFGKSGVSGSCKDDKNGSGREVLSAGLDKSILFSGGSSSLVVGARSVGKTGLGSGTLVSSICAKSSSKVSLPA